MGFAFFGLGVGAHGDAGGAKAGFDPIPEAEADFFLGLVADAAGISVGRFGVDLCGGLCFLAGFEVGAGLFVEGSVVDAEGLAEVDAAGFVGFAFEGEAVEGLGGGAGGEDGEFFVGAWGG